MSPETPEEQLERVHGDVLAMSEFIEYAEPALAEAERDQAYWNACWLEEASEHLATKQAYARALTLLREIAEGKRWENPQKAAADWLKELQ
jgi:hypothetical protein